MLRTRSRLRPVVFALAALVLVGAVMLAGGRSPAETRTTSFATLPQLRNSSPNTSPNATAVTTSNRSDPPLRRIGFRSQQRLVDHYRKHGREFGNVTMAQYLAKAQDLRDAPLSSKVVEAEQSNGSISRFDRRSGAFIAFDSDLIIRTFFRPDDGEDYFRRAARRR